MSMHNLCGNKVCIWILLLARALTVLNDSVTKEDSKDPDQTAGMHKLILA